VPNPFPKFREVQRARNGEYTLVRFRAAAPEPVQIGGLGQMHLSGWGTLVYVESAQG
jgi:hypothetical protein